MNINRRNRLLAYTLVTAFVFMALSPALSGAQPVFSLVDLNVGPNAEKVVFKVIATEDNMILAMQSGAVDLHDSFIEPTTIPIFDADPNIEVSENVLRNAYGHIVMNNAKSPMNWTAFRRAFAFAFDKTRVQSEVFQGLSQLHDSLVVYTNDLFTIEDDLPYHYYLPEVERGNQLLNDSGFGFDPVTGYRTDPNGNPIHIEVAYSPSSQAIAGGTAQIGVDALRALHVSAETNQEDFNTYSSNLDQHGDYDMIFYATIFYGKTLNYLVQRYGSEYADVPYQNPSNFRNETIDRILDDIQNARTYEEAFAACAEFQLEMQYLVPILITYENFYLQGYRTDRFKGHLVDRGRYLNSKWNLQKLINLDDSYGGTINLRIGQEPDTFNIFTSNSGYTSNIVSTMYSLLYDFGPDLDPYPVLAESYTEETHADNPNVPAGHHRFTFNVIQNATWSDGTPFTAEDVAFTFTYLQETLSLGNPSGATLADANLVAAYAPSPYQVVVEFGTESYWNFGVAAYNYIIPKHIFEPGAGIGYEGWNTWNPANNPEDPFVTLGPYKFNDFEAGEFYEVIIDPNWAYLPEDRFATPTTSTTPTGGPTEPVFDATLAIVAGAVGAAVVILVGGFVLLRQK
ncbi:MAG: ABC transporter substrate-binding protein [Candidatus Sifarchaeia archaeon]